MSLPCIHTRTHRVLAHNLSHKYRSLLQECLSLSPSTPLLHDEHLYSALQPCCVAGQCGSYCPNLLSAVLCLQVGVLWERGWTTNHELEWCYSAVSRNCLPARWSLSLFYIYQVPFFPYWLLILLFLFQDQHLKHAVSPGASFPSCYILLLYSCTHLILLALFLCSSPLQIPFGTSRTCTRAGWAWGFWISSTVVITSR